MSPAFDQGSAPPAHGSSAFPLAALASQKSLSKNVSLESQKCGFRFFQRNLEAKNDNMNIVTPWCLLVSKSPPSKLVPGFFADPADLAIPGRALTQRRQRTCCCGLNALPAQSHEYISFIAWPLQDS